MPKKAKKTAAKKKAAKTSSKAPEQVKADFVRSQSLEMPAKEVEAKAKAAGITLSDGYVYKIRSNDRKKQKKPSPKAASKKASGGRVSTGRGAKKSRVLDLVAKNPSWGAEQIAKAAGCSATYVYSVWREKPNGASPATTVSSSPTNGATTEFYRAVKKVGGVPKAKELLANIEAFQNA